MGEADVTLDSRVFACSWSGGKDSYLALQRAVKSGGKPAFLLTMLTEGGERSRSHGLEAGVLRAQSAALGIPIIFRAATWADYEEVFLEALKEMKQKGVEVGIFGDIDLQGHRDWVERVCAQAGLAACEPLWGGQRRQLLDELISSGATAKIVAVRQGALNESYLGRTLDDGLVGEFERLGIDPSGENGEYHTVVTGGPLFSHSLVLEEKGSVLMDGCHFLDVGLSAAAAGDNRREGE